MWRKLFIICMLGFAAWNSAQAASTEQAPNPETTPGARRIALLIGNGDYPDNPLRNPVHDVRAMSRLLAAQGFEVMHYENLTSAQMKQALHSFNQRLHAGGIGLFYFSGHGLQLANRTLLAPVDSGIRFPARLIENSIDLHSVLAGMLPPRAGKRNLIILDTCLNNPFGSGTTGMPKLPAQTLVAYATSPGRFAADGTLHGVYTAELIKSLAMPGLEVSEAFTRVASSVAQLTGHEQIPQMSSTLSGTMVLAQWRAQPRPAPQDNAIVALQSRAILPKDSSEQYELAFWDSIKDSDHAADYEAYLQAYPNGRFAALAKARIARLRAAAPKSATPAPATREPEQARPKPPKVKKTPKEAPQETPPQAQPAPAAPASAAGAKTAEITDCPGCPALISVPGGAFTMGNNASDLSEKPAHKVTLAAPFAIGKYEITIAQWNACVEAGGCAKPGADAKGAPNTPVRDVSWDDAQQYVKWLSKLSGKAYRLPTEAEWEFAARGGTSTRFWWGEKMETGKADCKDCGPPWTEQGPLAVGSFAANPFGLHDVNGSVWEWVEDCWHTSYKGAPADGHAWETPNCRERVIRGGSWREGASYMLSTTRFKYAASVRDGQNGFRVARSVK